MNERYSRQTLFAPIGADGQARLGRSRVVIAGCGALGSMHAEMLARAGVGRLRIIDRDVVETSNLQRQTLFSENDADEKLPKAAAAARRLGEINSDVKIEPLVADINNSNVEKLIADADLVIDGTDNFQTRYLINDACVKRKVAWIYGAAVSAYGTTMTIIPGRTPCLRCVFRDLPDAASAPTCETAGVIMPIIAAVSSIQIAEALKLLVGKNEDLHGSLMQIDLWANERRSIRLGLPEADCPACTLGKFEFLDAERAEFAATLCGRNAVQVVPSSPMRLDLAAFAEKVTAAADGNVIQNEYLVRFDGGGHRIAVFGDGRAIIEGTDDAGVARSIYARFVGA